MVGPNFQSLLPPMGKLISIHVNHLCEPETKSTKLEERNKTTKKAPVMLRFYSQLELGLETEKSTPRLERSMV